MCINEILRTRSGCEALKLEGNSSELCMSTEVCEVDDEVRNFLDMVDA